MTWRGGRSRKAENDLLGPHEARVSNAIRLAAGAVVNPSRARQDAFGNQIVVNPLPLYNFSQVTDINSDQAYTTQSAGGTFATVTYAANQSSTLLNISDGGVSAAGAYAMMSTKYVPYIPACGQRAEITFTMVDAAANMVQEAGYFEAPLGVATNGVFLRYSTAGTTLVLVSDIGGAVVETEVAQSAWNGDDCSDFDPTVRVLMIVDLQWLSVGQAAVLFDMGAGDIRLAHTFDNVQTGDTPYMRSATLPCTWLARATGDVASKRSMRAVCASVKAMGADEFPGVRRVVGRGATALAVTGRVPFVSFRCQSRYVPAIVRTVELLSSAEPLRWELVLNGTLGGPAWPAWAALTGTRLDRDVSATTLANGAILASGYAGAGGAGAHTVPGVLTGVVTDKRWASMSPTGTFDIVTLAVQSLTGAATNVYADLQVQEVI